MALSIFPRLDSAGETGETVAQFNQYTRQQAAGLQIQSETQFTN